MKPGDGYALSTLDGDDVIISVVKANEGYVWIRMSEHHAQRVVSVQLSDDDAVALAAALRRASR